MNFALICPWREPLPVSPNDLVLVTVPNVSRLLKLPRGLLKFAWLNTLKNSARISNPMASLIIVLLEIPKSVTLIPGPWKNWRLALSNPPFGPLANPPHQEKQPAWAGVGSPPRKLAVRLRRVSVTTFPTTLSTTVLPP